MQPGLDGAHRRRVARRAAHPACSTSPARRRRPSTCAGRSTRSTSAASAPSNLLDIARRAGARFFLASTSEVYGDPLVHPQPETYWGNVNPIGERSVYDEAKRFAEAITMAYHRHHGLDVRIVRIFNTYGPRMQADDGRVVTNFVNQALRGEPLTVYGDGTPDAQLLLRRRRGARPAARCSRARSSVRSTSATRSSSRCSSSPTSCSSSRVRRPRSSTARSRRTIRSCVSPTSRSPARCWLGSRRSRWPMAWPAPSRGSARVGIAAAVV